MDERESILLENFSEYYKYANQALNENKYNTATILFFKAIASLCDLICCARIRPSHHHAQQGSGFWKRSILTFIG